MNFKPACSWVSLIATLEIAHEWFFTSMSELVSLQVALCNKLLFALRAHKRSLSSVGSHMCFKVSSFREFFQTFFEWAQEYLFLIFGSLYFLDQSFIEFR